MSIEDPTPREVRLMELAEKILIAKIAAGISVRMYGGGWDMKANSRNAVMAARELIEAACTPK